MFCFEELVVSIAVVFYLGYIVELPLKFQASVIEESILGNHDTPAHIEIDPVSKWDDANQREHFLINGKEVQFKSGEIRN